jgi:hypothetical protein
MLRHTILEGVGSRHAQKIHSMFYKMRSGAPDRVIDAPDLLRMSIAQEFHLSCDDEHDTSSSGLESGHEEGGRP